jgi:hypothetical protein
VLSCGRQTFLLICLHTVVRSVIGFTFLMTLKATVIDAIIFILKITKFFLRSLFNSLGKLGRLIYINAFLK